MQCPKCRETMDVSDSSGLDTRTCFYCDGTWVRKAELQTLLAKETQSESYDAILKKVHLDNKKDVHWCPECPDSRLKQIFVNLIELDVCPKCNGLFFDRGELKNVLPTVYVSRKEKRDAALKVKIDPVAVEGGSWIVLALGYLIGMLSG